MKNIKLKIEKAIATGFFHIMISSVLKNILAFISGVVIVRIVSKSNYGVYSYANNILSYFMLFSGFGMASSVFQVCCEKRKDGEIPKDIFSYGTTIGIMINSFIGIAIAIYAIVFKGNIVGTEKYLIWMSSLPVFNISFEFVTIYYRSKSENKNYAYIYSVGAIATFLFSIIGSCLFGVWGLIASNYLTPLSSIVFAKYKMGYTFEYNTKVSKVIKHDLWKLAITSMTTNAISNVMYLIDISVIGILLKDELQVASYKIAVTIPTALVFVPLTIVTYTYPYFAEHKDDIAWTKYRAKQTLACCFVLFGTICFGLFVLSYPIITIVFGNQYADAVPIFKILIIAFFFQSCFRVIFGNLLVSQRKLKFNLVESILTGIINIIGDYILIQKYGAVGVALSTLIVMVFSGTLATSYYFFVLNKRQKITENNK